MLKKYKLYSKIHRIKQIPLRFLRFKRPKWQHLQKILLQSSKKIRSVKFLRRNQSFVLGNFNSIYISLKRWRRLDRFYKERLELKTRIALLYKIRVNKLKTKVKRENYLTNIYKSYFILTSMMCHAHLARSVREAQKKIEARGIKVNNKYIIKNCLLNKGDKVLILPFLGTFKHLTKIHSYNLFLFPHLEIDIYSQSIFVVKSLSDLSLEDASFLTIEKINLESAY